MRSGLKPDISLVLGLVTALLCWPAVQACEMVGGFALCAPQTNAVLSARGVKDDALMIINQFETSPAQRLLTSSLKLSMRGDEEYGGGFVMAKRGIIETPHRAQDDLNATFTANRDRNTLNAFTLGWEMVQADSYFALSAGRQWSQRSNQAKTILYEQSQTATLSGTMIERWKNGFVLSLQLDVDALRHGATYKSSVMLPLDKEMMIGPEVTLYRDRNFQRQRLGTALGGIKMMGSDYHLALGYESDSLGHQGLYTAIMASRRF